MNEVVMPATADVTPVTENETITPECRVKMKQLYSFLNQYNTYWVTIDGKKYLCLGYVVAPIKFKLGRFNYLNKEIITINHTVDKDFKLVLNGNIALIRKSNGSTIAIEGIYDKEHSKNDKPFDTSKFGYNLLREEFVDYERSFDKGNLRYYVIDLFRIGDLHRMDKNIGMNIYDWFRADFAPFDGTGKTLTYCYICNLLTRKVEKMVKWDVVNECEV